jgi:hypothetical protein
MRVLLILINCFFFYLDAIKRTGRYQRVGLGDDDKNGPKRRQTRRLGLGTFFFCLYLVLFFFVTILIYTKYM